MTRYFKLDNDPVQKEKLKIVQVSDRPMRSVTQLVVDEEELLSFNPNAISNLFDYIKRKQ